MPNGKSPAGGGDSGGGDAFVRPALDANHLYAWNMDEPGNVIVDSVSGTDLQFAGSSVYTREATRPLPFAKGTRFSHDSFSDLSTPITYAYSDAINIPAGNEITLECSFWLERLLANASTYNNLVWVFGPDGYAQPAAAWLGLLTGDSNIHVGTRIAAQNRNNQFTAPKIVLQPGRPYHAMMTYSFAAGAGTVRAYINGTLLASDASQLNPLPAFTGIRVGGSNEGYNFDGFLSDVRISNIARNAAYARAMASSLYAIG